MKKTILIFIFLLFIPSVLATTNNLTLLAVQETNNTYQGSTAQLTLETMPGTSRVFIDTYPITKLDTQISTRFAKEIACNYFDFNCQNYDFFYTIHSKSSIIGGPSAGAAIAALTVINIKDLNYNPNTTITGTINSGGIIGPVGGLKEKIEAAAQKNIKKVLIPQGTRFQKDKDNFSLDLVEFGREYDTNVVEVSDLNQVIYHLTNQTLVKQEFNFNISQKYTTIMRDISSSICNRTNRLKNNLTLNNTQKKHLINQTEKAQKASSQKDYYSSASYCFGLNYFLQRINMKNITYEQALSKEEEFALKIESIKKEIKDTEFDQINTLQAYTIVMERLTEAEQYLHNLNKDNYKSNLPYAIERYYTAVEWANFFKMSGKKLKINQKTLADSCLKKIQEAQERYHYVGLFIPIKLENIKEEIDRARSAYNKEDHALCLIKASQVKANVNTILSTLGVEEEKLDLLIDSKIKAVEKSLAKATSQGFFPVLGYSYYEYALSLKNSSPQSSLLYLEYALEMSNFDIYFEETNNQTKEPSKKTQLDVSNRDVTLFLLGFFLALIAVYIYQNIKNK